MPQYCLVKHHIVSSVIDGPDLGNDPDTVPISGDVTFYPILDHGDSVVVTVGAEKISYILAPISARIVQGKISVNGEEGVKLFAGGPDTNPERIRYRAKFTDLNISGRKRINLKDILFEAIPGGELTLSMAQPVPGAPYPGYSATIEQGITKIEGARDEALGQVSGAVAAEVDAIKWDRGHVPLDATSISDLAVGSWRVSNDVRAAIVASPGLRLGNVSIGGIGTSRTAFFVSQGTASEPPTAWVQAERGGVWSEWDRLAFTDAMVTADTALEQRIDGKADTAHTHTSTDITDATSSIAYNPNRVVKTNSEGKIFIPTESITGLGDPANKAYVDAQKQGLSQQITDSMPWRGRVPRDSDLNLWHGPTKRGAWDINPFTDPVANYPGAGTGYLWVEATPGGYTKQRLWLAGLAPREMIRFQTSATQPTWTGWEDASGLPAKITTIESDLDTLTAEITTIESDLDTLTDAVADMEMPPVTPIQPGDPALEHMMRVSDMRRRLGPVAVGDKGAVTIVFDHGTVNFQQWVYPLLQARGMKATLAMNAANVGTSVHELPDWSEMIVWSNNGIEIANHGMTHQSASGYEAIRAEITGGREAIEAAIGKPVDTYVQVGMGDAAFDGFGIGRSVDAYATTHAGTIILQSHAVVLGGISQVGATYHIDGYIPQGFNGVNWLDSGSESAMTNAKMMIDRAVTQKKRVVIRCHPQSMGEGKLTQDILADFLDYIQAKISSGQLEMLTAREWAIANK